MPLHYDTHRDESLYLCDHWSFDSQQHNGLGLTALLSEMIEDGALAGFVWSCKLLSANDSCQWRTEWNQKRGGCKVINRVFARIFAFLEARSEACFWPLTSSCPLHRQCL